MPAEVVTVADVADALGLPGQVGAIHEGLIADGIKIIEDWAGRPSIAFTDAKRTVDRHRKQQAEWTERRQREEREYEEARAAQHAFDDFAGRRLPELRKAEPFKNTSGDDAVRIVRARQEAYAAIKDTFSADALSKLTISTIVTTEREEGPAFRLIPTYQTTDIRN